MKVRGSHSLRAIPSHQTPALSASAASSAPRLRSCDQWVGGRRAMVSSTAAATKRPASQKLIAFSGLLGVTRSGMPANDSVCARSIRPTARKPTPRMTGWLFPRVPRRFQPSAKTIAEMAMATNSSVM